METQGVSSTTTAPTSELVKTRKSIADNFDTFLTLLTTQLKNQNPLEPVDTNQFTQQLVQFTSVEQQLKTNEYLEALVLAGQNVDGNQHNAANQAVGLIGKTVVAESTKSQLTDGSAKWTFTTPRAAPTADVTIKNSAGAVVYQNQVALAAGRGDFEWDGQDASGLAFPDGTYTISIDAKDAGGNNVTVLTQVKGKVSSVDLTGTEPVLTVGDSRITLSGVLSVTETVAAATETSTDTETDDTESDDSSESA